MRIPFGGEFYQSESKPISAQECVNLYLHYPQAQTSSPEALLLPAGIESGTTAGSSSNRGSHNFKGVPYFVQGGDLYSIAETIDGAGNKTYTATKVNGAVTITGAGQVIMRDNGNDGDQMVIVDPESSAKFNAWIYDGSTLSAISDNDFDGPVSTVDFIDGYFTFTKKDGQKVFISDLRDGSSYIATDFTEAEADPDNTVGQWVLNKETWFVFGEETFQPYQNVGGSGFPFQTIPGATQSVGLRSKFAIEEIAGQMIWLGGRDKETPRIWMSSGGQPVPVSTAAIDSLLGEYPDSVLDVAFCWRYAQAGAEFVAFTFPTQITLVYEHTASKRAGRPIWHTRVSKDGETEIPCRIASVAFAFNRILVGDSISNKIGLLSETEYQEYGADIPHYFITPQLGNDGMPFFIHSLELVVESGVGSSTDANVGMNFSTDGGRTFNNEMIRSAGKVGEYNTRTIWNSLGRIAREVCFRFNLYGARKWVVRGLEANFD